MHDCGSKLKVIALQHERDNAGREISVLKDQINLLNEKVPVQQQLLDKGLITKQQLIDTQQKIVELKGKISEQEADINSLDSQIYAAQADPLEADETAKAQVLQYRGQVDTLEQQLKQAADVVSPFSGEVIEVKLTNGDLVNTGTGLLSIQPDVHNLEVIAYINSREAKNIQKGMDAQISPSTVKREESGYLRGKVESVADFPATPEAIMRNFHNQTFVQSMAQRGPVTEVRLRLEPDAGAPSGFRWSSPKSPNVKLSSGTLCNAEVVTEMKVPMELLLPWFKKTTGL
jgi:HlyD family secretion protein